MNANASDRDRSAKVLREFRDGALTNVYTIHAQLSIKGALSMQINISGHHVDVTPALHDYVISKVERISRHSDQITNMHVVLTVEKTRQSADATVHMAGADIAASAESQDMYAAIDLLADRLDRQVIKHKEKVKDKKQGLVGR